MLPPDGGCLLGACSTLVVVRLQVCGKANYGLTCVCVFDSYSGFVLECEFSSWAIRVSTVLDLSSEDFPDCFLVFNRVWSDARTWVKKHPPFQWRQIDFWYRPAFQSLSNISFVIVAHLLMLKNVRKLCTTLSTDSWIISSFLL